MMIAPNKSYAKSKTKLRKNPSNLPILMRPLMVWY